MTSSQDGGLQVLSTQRFEVDPPNNQLVSPDDQLASTKEEEWVTKKKVEVVTKRQIATRVQREVLLEDGKVVQDSGPKVTTTTTEDTQKQESENTEHHDVGDGGGEGWVPSPGDPAVLTEVREKKVTTREQTNETLETEDVKHLGDISDEAYKKAVQGGGNVENWLVRSPGTEIATTGPRVVGHTSSKRRVTDTEDTLKKRALDEKGQVVFNTSTIREHEEVIDDPEGQTSDSGETKEVHFKKVKDQKFVDSYVDGKPVDREMRYDAETTEMMRQGDANWDSLSARLRRNRSKFLKDIEEDRKDALTHRPLDFHQEERTRKMETSKWLDHHFGSESMSRSSKDSEDDGPQSSFINVTMKSTKESKPSKVFLSSPEPDNKYFKGISEWKSEEQRFTKSPKLIDGGVQVLPTGPNHTFNSSPSPPYSSPSPLQNGTKTPSPLHNGVNGYHHHGSKSPSPPVPPPLVFDDESRKFPSTQNLERNHSPLHPGEKYMRTTNYYKHERTTSPYGVRTTSPQQVGYTNGFSSSGSRAHSSTPTQMTNGKATPTRDYTPPSISPPPRRKHYRVEKEEEVQEEPAPDYSPTPEPKSRHNTPPPESKKKVYQRTRFAADIPPARNHSTPSTAAKEKRSGGGLGVSFRKLVGKLVGSGGGGSHGKRHHHNSHHGHGSPGSGGSGSSSGGGGGHHGQVVDSGTQTRGGDMNNSGPTVHKYYLGEDPFSSSLYGRESEYPSSAPHYRPRSKHKNYDDSRQQSSNSSTLGRLSKSTGKLSNDRQMQNGGTTLYYSDRGGVQTLPRKLQEHKAKKQVYVTRSNGDSSYNERNGRLNGANSNSMFNVSIVNNPSGGPAKPARTYRSNLLRSKSFNVHAGDSNREMSRYTSNPHLSTLDESTELKSPGLITSISRSTKDLTHDDSFRKPLGSYDQNRFTKRTSVDTKKKMFMKGLMDRAPELYKTLRAGEDEVDRVDHIRTSTPLKNGKLEYSTSFRSSNTSSPLDYRVQSPTSYYSYRTDSPSDVGGVNRSVVRRGSNDGGVNRSVVRRGSNDYTETVSYTTKSKDPLRPSVTNTVQSFTKKTLPAVGGGRKEQRIESTETKTVTKSKYRGGTPELRHHFEPSTGKYPSSNGGVIIEVRNTRK